MSSVFLDTNCFIDVIEPRGKVWDQQLDGQVVYISALSMHVLLYVLKYKVPNEKLFAVFDAYKIVELTESLLIRAASGPTSDFEDNVQLHSAAAANCDYFLTQDKKLLKLQYFGSVEICSKLPQ